MGLYFAMTQAELENCTCLPEKFGWLACHLSSGDTGLSNLPSKMPRRGLLCIDDSLLPYGHDPERIARQVQGLSAQLDGVILDFQRSYCPELDSIARAIQAAVPCPVAVTPPYTESWDGDVFIPPVPIHQPIAEHLAPWRGKKIWLEMDCTGLCMELTQAGCRLYPEKATLEPPVFQDKHLHCHYHIRLTENAALFSLVRTWDDQLSLMEEGNAWGVINAVGLYQEVGSICPPAFIE